MSAKKSPNPTRKTTSSVPAVGSPAPSFTLSGTGGAKVRLGQFKGKQNVVVYFYPRDNTPGCTKEACGFRDQIPRLKRSDTVVLGISSDGVESHEKFADKYGLPFILLADEDAAVAKKYGAWVEKNLYGRKSFGIQRSTFLVDKQGRLAAVWPKVKVDGHVGEVLEAIEQLAG
jgi:peroxiredoxin Q/BCP